MTSEEMRNQMQEDTSAVSPFDGKSAPVDGAGISAVDENIKTLRVYRKKSTFKDAATPYWYSATNSSGKSVICKFKCAIPDAIKDEAAFEIYDILGGSKVKTVEVKGETYENLTYYIESCKFRKVPAVALPI